jgi:hypothetical protein
MALSIDGSHAIVSLYLRAAESAPNEALRQGFLGLAERPLERLRGFTDGCSTAGEPDGDDLLLDCQEQAGALKLVLDTTEMLEAELLQGCPLEPPEE